MFETLTQYVSGSPWTYAFLFGIAALDVVFPLVPSETSVILGGVLAATGDLMLAASDRVCGRRRDPRRQHGVRNRENGGPSSRRAFFKGERRKRVDWAEQQVKERGGYLIVIGRFIPGGRTAVTLACGLLEIPLA